MNIYTLKTVWMRHLLLNKTNLMVHTVMRVLRLKFCLVCLSWLTGMMTCSTYNFFTSSWAHMLLQETEKETCQAVNIKVGHLGIPQLYHMYVATHKSFVYLWMLKSELIIVVLTLQPILKLPPLWNVKYPELSFPIILYLVWVVPSCGFDATGNHTDTRDLLWM